MRMTLALLCLALAACGSQPANQSANMTAAASADAVTAEAVSDTKAAEADALKAADAELDNLGDTIDDAGNGAGDPANRVSSTTKVETY